MINSLENRITCFSDGSLKGHYMWISLMTELFKRCKIEVDVPNFIIKKEINPIQSKECLWGFRP